MFDDFSAYFFENVVTAFVDYREISLDAKSGASRDIRNALTAASALFHVREHVPTAFGISRSEVEQKCPDYALLGDIVNAAKHRRISNRTPHGNPHATDAGQISEQIVVTDYEDDEGVYRHYEKLVCVKRSDGIERNLMEVLTNVINFWEKHLYSLGLIDSEQQFIFVENNKKRSRTECTNTQMGLCITKGQRFAQKFKFQRFDNQAGKVVPVDLTGSNIIFTVRRPPNIEIEIALHCDETQAISRETVKLTDEESFKYGSATTEDERNEIVQSFESVQIAIQKLLLESQRSNAK